MLRGIQDLPLDVKYGEFDEVRAKILPTIKYKTIYIIVLTAITLKIYDVELDGLSTLHLTKKLWLVGYLSFIIFANTFGLVLRLITYYWPEILFIEDVQDHLDNNITLTTNIGLSMWTGCWFVKLLKYPLAYWEIITEYKLKDCE